MGVSVRLHINKFANLKKAVFHQHLSGTKKGIPSNNCKSRGSWVMTNRPTEITTLWYIENWSSCRGCDNTTLWVYILFDLPSWKYIVFLQNPTIQMDRLKYQKIDLWIFWGKNYLKTNVEKSSLNFTFAIRFIKVCTKEMNNISKELNLSHKPCVYNLYIFESQCHWTYTIEISGCKDRYSSFLPFIKIV